MATFRALWSLGALDARLVGRDSLLRGLLLLPLVVALAARLVVPAVLARLGDVVGLDPQALYEPLMSYVLLVIGPLLCGMAAGFMLLDQRDDGTLVALEVTPLSPSVYLAYRLAGPLLIALAVTPLAFLVAGLPIVGPAALLAAALLSAPLAPLAALALAAFARDKLQGMALLKVSGALLALPFGAYFTPGAYDLLFGLLPTFWPAYLWWGLAEGDGSAWLALPLGLGYMALLGGLLARRFAAVTHR